MKTLFLCTSAIHTHFGKFSTDERMEQTIATLESIKTKVPDAKIIVIECSGEQSITVEESERLKPYVEGVLNFYHDQQVQDIYTSITENWDIVKNMTEMVVFGKALDFIIHQQPHLLNDIDRVFKISG